MNNMTMTSTSIPKRVRIVTSTAYPIHNILDNAKPVVFTLNPVNGLFLSQMMPNVIEVTLHEYLSLSLCLNHYFSLFFFLRSHII